jgi:hypothetical protein
MPKCAHDSNIDCIFEKCEVWNECYSRPNKPPMPDKLPSAEALASAIWSDCVDPTPWQFNTLMQVRRGKEALIRLSAPVDVQAKAEAVAKAFIETHARMLTEYETCELVRLIVEQFSRKG